MRYTRHLLAEDDVGPRPRKQAKVRVAFCLGMKEGHFEMKDLSELSELGSLRSDRTDAAAAENR